MAARVLQVKKVGGSTVGGVVRRVAAHHNIHGYNSSKWTTQEPMVWAQHGFLSRVEPEIANLTLPVFLLTFLRNPVEVRRTLGMLCQLVVDSVRLIAPCSVACQSTTTNTRPGSRRK